MTRLPTALDHGFLLRAGVTLLVLAAVEAARVLYVMPRGAVADAVAVYLSVLLGGLFTAPARGAALDDASGVMAFLLAPLGVVAAVGVLALPFAVGGLDLRLGVVVLGAGLLASLAILAAAALVPAAAWALPPDKNPLAVVAGGVVALLRSHLFPGGVAAAGFVVGSLLR